MQVHIGKLKYRTERRLGRPTLLEFGLPYVYDEPYFLFYNVGKYFNLVTLDSEGDIPFQNQLFKLMQLGWSENKIKKPLVKLLVDMVEKNHSTRVYKPGQLLSSQTFQIKLLEAKTGRFVFRIMTDKFDLGYVVLKFTDLNSLNLKDYPTEIMSAIHGIMLGEKKYKEYANTLARYLVVGGKSELFARFSGVGYDNKGVLK